MKATSVLHYDGYRRQVSNILRNILQNANISWRRGSVMLLPTRTIIEAAKERCRTRRWHAMMHNAFNVLIDVQKRWSTRSGEGTKNISWSANQIGKLLPDECEQFTRAQEEAIQAPVHIDHHNYFYTHSGRTVEQITGGDGRPMCPDPFKFPHYTTPSLAPTRHARRGP